MGPPIDEGPDVPGHLRNTVGNLPILHDLPALVVRTLQKHFYAGIKHAEIRFRFHAANEDSVTGALGNDLVEPEPILIGAGEERYAWRTFYFKVRSQGFGAPEKKLG